MIEIRKIKDSDKEALRQICLDTSSFDISKKNMKEFLYLMYNDYYTENEKDVCFAAVDENDEPVGYLLCCKNYSIYEKIFNESYQKKIDSLGLKYAFMSRSEKSLHKKFSTQYPTHLHIDLTAKCRRQGVGTRLISSLKEELKAQNIHSIMLSCGSSNKAAVSFYEKNGFKTVKKFLGSNIMVLNF